MEEWKSVGKGDRLQELMHYRDRCHERDLNVIL